MNESATGGHPLYAAFVDHIFMAATIFMGYITIDDKSDRFHASMRMWSKRKAVVIWPVNLWSMMVQKYERIDYL